MPAHAPAGLPSELVHRRPDLIVVERELLVSDARVAQSRANLRPRFTLTSAAGTASNQLRDLVDGDLLVWNLIGGLIQPIYNRGRLKAGVAHDEAMVTEAMARYEGSLLRAYGEVEIALAAEDILARREVALESATRQSLAARDLAEDRYRRGLADIITVLSSQRTALDSESQLLALRRQRLDNRVDLHLALGGGFEAAAPVPPSGLQQRPAADGPREGL
jgi:outer membrane protein TolC